MASDFFNKPFDLVHHRFLNKDNLGLERFLLLEGQKISPLESFFNLKKNIIEITYEGKHCSNGLLVTNTGYFLTPEHCLRKFSFQKEIRFLTGESYPITDICHRDIDYDIALGKADIKNLKNSSIGYRIHDTKNLNFSSVKLLTLWNKELREKKESSLKKA